MPTRILRVTVGERIGSRVVACVIRSVEAGHALHAVQEYDGRYKRGKLMRLLTLEQSSFQLIHDHFAKFGASSLDRHRDLRCDELMVLLSRYKMLDDCICSRLR